MDTGFIAGLGFVLAWVKRWYGLDSVVEELYRDAGFKYREYEKVCDEYDLLEIQKIAAAVKSWSRRKQQTTHAGTQRPKRRSARA